MPHGETDSMSDVGEPEMMKRNAAGEEAAVIKRRKQETPEDEAVVESAEPVIRSDVAAEEKEQQAEDPADWRRIREQAESKIGPTLEVSLVAMIGLVAAIQSGNRQSR